MERVKFVYGPDYTEFSAEVKNLKTVKVREMAAQENRNGFVVLLDAVDDLGEKRDGLQVYVHGKHADVPNLKLLTAVLKGDVEEVLKFELSDDFGEE